MNYYYIQLSKNDLTDIEQIEAHLLTEFEATGIEDFNIDEPRVDEILGSRSYSGGDLPLDVLEEVEQTLVESSEVFKNIHFDNIENANKALNYLKTKTNSQNLKITEIKTEDWNEKWKKSYKPIKINDRLEIIPEWETNYTSLCENKIYIYPGMGFGTGSHETTYLCLKLLVENIKVEDVASCLDYGCGSGILALALNIIKKQDQTDYYDIDQEALDNTTQNIELNKLEHNYRLLLTKDSSKLYSDYDLVFANILQDVLLENSWDICNKTTKYLIVSGLLNGQEEEVINKYEKINNLKMSKIERKGDWLAILFLREE